MDSIILIFELIGTVAFAVSGAMVSISKRFDIFGVLFCAAVTALGGGVERDVLLANLPPVMFRDYVYLITALLSALVTFIIARIIGKKYTDNIEIIDKVDNVFDALGLGVFTVVGINTAVSSGYGENAFFVIFLGMTTGCGGGIIRDVIVREVPFVLSKRIYAVASIGGGIVYYLMYVSLGLNEVLSVLTGIILIFAVRILASVFKWDLPKAI